MAEFVKELIMFSSGCSNQHIHAEDDVQAHADHSNPFCQGRPRDLESSTGIEVRSRFPNQPQRPEMV